MSKSPEKPSRARLIKKGALPPQEPPLRSSDPLTHPEPIPREQKKSAKPPTRLPDRMGTLPSSRARGDSPKKDRMRTPTSIPDQWGVVPDRPLFPSAQTKSRSLLTREGQKIPRRAPRRKGARPKTVVLRKLTPEQRRAIEERYRAMIASDIRPPEGRRRTIARELGVPYALVSEVVKDYLHRERLRRTNFQIEKIYWAEVLAGEDDAEQIAQRAATQLHLDVGRVWWWLEKLHEWRKPLDAEPDVTDEQRAAILAFYREYLMREEPPEKGLHSLISETIGGITPRQVHKVLLHYRLNVWNRLKNTTRPASS